MSPRPAGPNAVEPVASEPRPAPIPRRPPLDRLCTAAGEVLPPMVMGSARLAPTSALFPFGRRERKRVFDLLDEVFEAGCRAFELGSSHRLGGARRIFGEWLCRAGVRDRVFLILGVGHPSPLDRRRLGTTALESDLRAGLHELSVEQVDLVLLCRDHAEASLPHMGANLSRFRRDGRSRYTGVSNWTFERIEALDRATGERVVDMSSPQLSLAEWPSPPRSGQWSISGRKHRYERRQYAKTGLPTLAFDPLGRGFFASRPPRGLQSRLNDARRRRCETLGRRLGVTPAQVALAYLTSQAFPVFPLVRVTCRAQMAESLAAVDLELSIDDLRWLEGGYPNE